MASVPRSASRRRQRPGGLVAAEVRERAVRMLVEPAEGAFSLTKDATARPIAAPSDQQSLVARFLPRVRI
jgi:hypothetical protein